MCINLKSITRQPLTSQREPGTFEKVASPKYVGCKSDGKIPLYAGAIPYIIIDFCGVAGSNPASLPNTLYRGLQGT